MSLPLYINWLYGVSALCVIAFVVLTILTALFGKKIPHGIKTLLLVLPFVTVVILLYSWLGLNETLFSFW
ncbi:hypothetical protein FWF93_00995 [Candidatus Saccharibacteria bacterium]|nr:hypothetical protein [Candidatus Saccharibacteria bacterium]